VGVDRQLRERLHRPRARPMARDSLVDSTLVQVTTGEPHVGCPREQTLDSKPGTCLLPLPSCARRLPLAKGTIESVPLVWDACFSATGRWQDQSPLGTSSLTDFPKMPPPQEFDRPPQQLNPSHPTQIRLWRQTDTEPEQATSFTGGASKLTAKIFGSRTDRRWERPATHQTTSDSRAFPWRC
jgi:hypothetical protein